MKEHQSLSLEFKVVEEKIHVEFEFLLKKDLGLCMLGLFLPWVSYSVLHTLWNLSLYTWIIYSHQLETQVSKTQVSSLNSSLKYLKY